MKLKGLRWWVIGLIMLITIINYLDRGTLNYMWVANIEYSLVDQIDASKKMNQAQYSAVDDTYRLVTIKGEEVIQKKSNVAYKHNGQTIVNRQGIAYDLGIVDANATPEVSSKQAKDLLGQITIFSVSDEFA